MKPVNRAFELSLLGLLALFWGSSYLFVKVGLESIPPLTLVAVRVLIAALLMLAVLAIRGYRLPRDFAVWRQLLLQAALNSFGAWALLAWGQQYVDSGLAGVLNSTAPIFVFFLTWLVTRHESVNLRKLIGAVLGLVGVIWIIGAGALSSLGQAVVAQLAILTGSLMYACAAIYGKRFASLPAPVTATCVLIWACIVMIPASLIFEAPWQVQPSWRSALAVSLLSVFSTAGALMLYYRLVHTLGSMGVASQAYLRSGVSVLLGVLILGEVITPTLGVGLAAAIVGVALINWPDRQRIAK